MHRERCEEDEATGGACRERRPIRPAPHPTSAPGVWLGGNPRAGVGALFLGLLASALGALLLLPAGDALPGVVRGVVVGLPALLGAGAFLAARQPRLVHVPGAVIVRLAPFRRQRVPLDVVECFFLGSRLEPPRDAATSAGDRVRTLVMRIAERAGDHADRPTLPAWGSWSEGSVTFDGRWCAPLSVDLVRRLNKALAEAKRAGAEERAASTGGSRWSGAGCS